MLIPAHPTDNQQNPWKETTPRKLRSDSIPLIRRRSGGGTVYHARFLYLISVSSDFVWQDLGNTNFSIILPRLLFTRAHGAELVARAIRDRLGIEECGVSKRNDVVIRDRGKEYKVGWPICWKPQVSTSDDRSQVSGSAYKIIQHRAYHHGTMLISSSLAELGKSLKSSSVGQSSLDRCKLMGSAQYRDQGYPILPVPGHHPQHLPPRLPPRDTNQA